MKNNGKEDAKSKKIEEIMQLSDSLQGLYGEGRYDAVEKKALQALKLVKELMRDYPSEHFEKGIPYAIASLLPVYQIKGDLDNVVKYANEMLENTTEKPFKRNAYSNLYLTYLSTEAYGNAEDVVTRVMELDRDDDARLAGDFENRGVLRTLAGKVEEGAADFEKALSLNRKTLLPKIAMWYAMMNKREEAKRLYTEYIETAAHEGGKQQDDKLAKAFYERGRIRLKAGEKEGGFKDLEEAVSLSDGILLDAAALYHQNGNKEEADALFKRYLDASRDDWERDYRKMRVEYATSDSPEKALGMLEKLNAKTSELENKRLLYWTKANFLIQLKRFDEAEKTMRELESKLPKTPQTYALVNSILLELKSSRQWDNVLKR